MLRLRGFRLSVFCYPCKDVQFINLVERPDLADVAVGSVDFQCRQCGRPGHYRLTPPFRGEKPRLFEQASSCRGPADYDPTPFVGPLAGLVDILLLEAINDQLLGICQSFDFFIIQRADIGAARSIHFANL
jgi:hypothetical protein